MMASFLTSNLVSRNLYLGIRGIMSSYFAPNTFICQNRAAEKKVKKVFDGDWTSIPIIINYHHCYLGMRHNLCLAKILNTTEDGMVSIRRCVEF